MIMRSAMVALLLTASISAQITQGGPKYICNRVERLMSERNYEYAINFLNDGIKQYPDDASIRIYLAECYFAIDRYPRAEASFRAGIERDASLATRVPNYAFCLFKLERLDDAEKAYRLIFESAGDEVGRGQGAFGLGLVALHRGHLDNAHEHLALARKLAPGSRKTLFHLGMVLRRLKKPEEAISCFERVVALDGLHLAAVHNMALTLAQLGRREDSRTWRTRYFDVRKKAEEARDIELALREDPANVALLERLGAIFFDARRWEDAVAIYTALCVKKPTDPEPRYRLGLCRLKRGDRHKARVQFEQVLRRFGEYRDTKALHAGIVKAFGAGK